MTGQRPDWDYTHEEQLDEMEDRTRPSTMKYCHHCEEHVLRSRWDGHEEHDMEALDIRRYVRHNADLSSDDEDEEDEVVQVGGKYSVTLDYNATHSFTVYAGDGHQAKQKAKDRVEWGTATSGHLLHDDVREVQAIFSDDPEAEEYDLI